jgi:hypothetical protein
MYFADFGAPQSMRYDRLGQLSGLEGSCLNLKKAVQLTEDGNQCEVEYLGVCLLRRYERFGELADVQDSILKPTNGHQGKSGSVVVPW